jgi:hypothetical protein
VSAPTPSALTEVGGEQSARNIRPSRPTASSGLLKDFILESLSFKSMRDREEEVADAHGRTFDWILNPSVSHGSKAQNELGDHFTKWLGGDDLGSIYWGEFEHRR